MKILKQFAFRDKPKFERQQGRNIKAGMFINFSQFVKIFYLSENFIRTLKSFFISINYFGAHYSHHQLTNHVVAQRNKMNENNKL